MDRVNHLLFAAGLQAALAPAADLGATQTVVAMTVAGLASWGPDVDQMGKLKKLGGPLKHRGITHWWALPAVAAFLAHRADMGDVGWVIWALILGWVSHLLGDWLFGIRPRGIPLLPWSWHVGLGLDSGGKLEHLLVPPAALAATWVAFGGPIPEFG